MSNENLTILPWQKDFPKSTLNDKRLVSVAKHDGGIETTKVVAIFGSVEDADYALHACNNYDRMKAMLERASTIIKDGAVVFALKEHDHALKELQSIDALLSELNK